MQEEVIKFAHLQYQNILSDKSLLPQQKLYQLSMPLLALATLKHHEGYELVLADMEFILSDEQQKSQIAKPWQFWMQGRMALASKQVDNAIKLKTIKETLSMQLAESDSNDVITGWAVAYLAAIDKHSYDQVRERLFVHTEFARNGHKENPGSDFVWTLVMNLYAAANASHAEDYDYFRQNLKAMTTTGSLKTTALLVPNADYRLWWISIARYSFQLMTDEASRNELELGLGSINKSELNSLDSMLALANEIRSDSLIDSGH